MSFVCAAKHATRRGFIMTDDATKCKTTGRGRPAVPPSGTRHDARHLVLASLTHNIHACVCVQAPVPSHATLQNTRPRTHTYMAVRHSFALGHIHIPASSKPPGYCISDRSPAPFLDGEIRPRGHLRTGRPSRCRQARTERRAPHRNVESWTCPLGRAPVRARA